MADDSLEGIILGTIPKELIPLIGLALFLSLTIFFTMDRRRKLVNGKSKYEIFVNTCVFSFALLMIYLFVLYLTGLLFPNISTNQIYNSVIFLLWFSAIAFIVVYFKATAQEPNKNQLFLFLVSALDIIFIFGIGIIVAFIFSPFIRERQGILPTYASFLSLAIPIFTIIFLFFIVPYLFVRFVTIKNFAQAYDLPNPLLFRNVPWLPEPKWFFNLIILILIIGLFLLFVFVIQSTYTRNITNEESTFDGYLNSPSSSNKLTITTYYSINLTHLGASNEIPIELIHANEEIAGNDAHKLYAQNLYWLNSSAFNNNTVQLITKRQESTDPYFEYSSPIIYRDNEKTTIQFSFNFTGKKVKSIPVFITSFSQECQNITVNTTAESISFPRKDIMLFYTGAADSRQPHNDYSIILENESTRRMLFSFDVSIPDKLNFNIICLFSNNTSVS